MKIFSRWKAQATATASRRKKKAAYLIALMAPTARCQ
jgi:hypothetical protein